MSFHDKDALLFRLKEGLEETTKSVVFVVGAPAAASYGGVPGVANVGEIVELIRARYAKRGNQLATLDQRLESSDNRYQTAFEFVAGREGQDAANLIVKRAVAQALTNPPNGSWTDRIGSLSAEELNTLDHDGNVWNIPPRHRRNWCIDRTVSSALRKADHHVQLRSLD